MVSTLRISCCPKRILMKGPYRTSSLTPAGSPRPCPVRRRSLHPVPRQARACVAAAHVNSGSSGLGCAVSIKYTWEFENIEPKTVKSLTIILYGLHTEMIYCGFTGLNKIYYYNYFHLFLFTLLMWLLKFFKLHIFIRQERSRASMRH